MMEPSQSLSQKPTNRIHFIKKKFGSSQSSQPGVRTPNNTHKTPKCPTSLSKHLDPERRIEPTTHVEYKIETTTKTKEQSKRNANCPVKNSPV